MKNLYSSQIASTMLKLPYSKTFKIFIPKVPKGVMHVSSGMSQSGGRKWKRK